MYKIRLYSQPDISTAFQSQYQLKSKHADFYPVNIWFRCYYRALTFSEHAKSNKNHASYVDTGRPQSRYPMIQIDPSFPRIKIESNSKLKKKNSRDRVPIFIIAIAFVLWFARNTVFRIRTKLSRHSRLSTCVLLHYGGTNIWWSRNTKVAEKFLCKT